MKVISVWQPWATLLIQGFKKFETRTWQAPTSVIGTRIGIAATKQIKQEQIVALMGQEFQHAYSQTGLSALTELPRGCILGTALLRSSEIMTAESMAAVTETERTFGYWTPGRFAWLLEDLAPYDQPIFARGGQGIWLFNDQAQSPADQERPANARVDL
jgi:hypothetical protein